MGEVPSVEGAGYRRFIFSKYICKALLNFIASDSQEVTEQHLEIEAFDDDYLDSVCGSSPSASLLLLLPLLLFSLLFSSSSPSFSLFFLSPPLSVTLSLVLLFLLTLSILLFLSP